ncbi:MAG TPA: VCBS repeat-containing protein [Kofleriaceae bacterium]|nr:VCBS repeat-containing protein [Kofleriaceae bacterium]
MTRAVRGVPALRALIASCVLASSAPVWAGGADPHDSDAAFVDELWRQATAALEQAVAARIPPLRPPVPVPVTWRARRMGTVDLQAPLLALTAVDLDADGTSELVALTTREVLLLRRVDSRRVDVVGRLELPAGPSSLRPRDPVGQLAVIAGANGPEVLARASGSARGLAVALREGKLAELRGFDGFPVCDLGSVTLEGSRNYFARASLVWRDPKQAPALAGDFYATGCANGMVDVAGRPLDSFAVLATDGTLALRFERRCRDEDAECRSNPVFETTLTNVGIAFAVGDIDNDGLPEVISANDQPPGDPDRVSVYTPRGSRWQRVFQHGFSGGIAGIAIGDFDGDGAMDVATAVRLVGSDRVDLWSLD